jgi:antitoxin component HigA of HigAB toxin-antitoxin module
VNLKVIPKLLYNNQFPNNIIVINTIGIYYNLRVPEYEAFITNIYKINQILQNRQAVVIQSIDKDLEDWDTAV